MSKPKARIKGMGMDILFGGAEDQAPEPEKEMPVAPAAELRESPRPSEPAPRAVRSSRTASAPAHQYTGIPAHQHTSTRVDQRAGKIAPPVKATFYLQPEQVEELERLWTTVRSKHRIRVGKSEIVRVALDTVVAEYREKQGDSFLIQRLQAAADEERQRRESRGEGRQVKRAPRS